MSSTSTPTATTTSPTVTAATFRAKTNYMKSWRPRNPPSNRDRLELYALHKQSISGDAPPSTENDQQHSSMADKAKLSAWQTKRGMNREEAMAKYVDECDRQLRVYGTKHNNEATTTAAAATSTGVPAASSSQQSLAFSHHHHHDSQQQTTAAASTEGGSAMKGGETSYSQQSQSPSTAPPSKSQQQSKQPSSSSSSNTPHTPQNTPANNAARGGSPNNHYSNNNNANHNHNTNSSNNHSNNGGGGDSGVLLCPRGLAAIPLLCAAASESRSAYLARLQVTNISNGWWAKQEPLCLEVNNPLSIPEKLIISLATNVEHLSLIVSNYMGEGHAVSIMSPRVLQAFLWPVHNVFLCCWISLILTTTYLGSMVMMCQTLLFGAKRTNTPLGRLFMEEVHPSARAVESLCEQHQVIGVRVAGLALMPLMMLCDFATSVVGRVGILVGSLVFVGMGVCSWWYWICVLPWLAVCGLCLAVMSGWCFGLIELAGN